MAQSTHQMQVKKVEGWNPEQTIPVSKHDTVADAIKAGHFKDEQSLMNAANAARLSRLNRSISDKLQKDSTDNAGKFTLKPEDLSKHADSYTYGTRPEAKPKVAAPTRIGLAEKLKTAQATINSLGLSQSQIAKLQAAGVMEAVPEIKPVQRKSAGAAAGAAPTA